MWPLSNCYVDLWIEIGAALGGEPEAILGFAIEQDFEGDQFTFSKPTGDDLQRLLGVQLYELAVYDDIERHVALQVERGRLCLVEVDSYFLPDTRGLTYRCTHGKTTVAFNRLNPASRTAEYFHNGGYYRLEGEDYAGLMAGYAHGATPFLPYAEFVRFASRPRLGDEARDEAAAILGRRLRLAPEGNPVARFADALPAAAEVVAERGQDFFHLYAFNTLRQLGANFELFGDHLDWLGLPGDAADDARQIARTAKAAQFQLARACAKRRFDPLAGAVAPAVDAYARMRERLAGVAKVL